MTDLLSRVSALITRVVRAPESEEARTCAVIAIQTIHDQKLLSHVATVTVCREIPAAITDEDVDEIIKEHVRARASAGGRARAQKLSKERKREIATKAARAPRGRERRVV